MSQRRLQHEMHQKTNLRNAFFGLKSEPQDRPISVATEFVDTDWDEELMSEAEDNSPRHSLQSSGGQPSITTLSSYDEVHTPGSGRSQVSNIVGGVPHHKTVIEGPRGPHLFYASSIRSHEDQAILTLSPITPKTPRPFEDAISITMMHEPLPSTRSLPPRRRNSPFKFSREPLDTSNLVSWTPEMVAQSMLDAGMEFQVAERFVENDITGAILMTLKFEDLKELDIQSFGIRTKVWNQIQTLRDSRPSSPRAPTPIQDEPSKEVKKEKHKEEGGSCGGGMQRRKSSRRRPRNPSHDDIISPLESVSIVGIEQVIPKPHYCSKGENCSKYRKQQRLIEAFKKDHPYADLESGAVLIAGDPGNPLTARALDPSEPLRPISDAVPSVVASSDVLGPGGMPPLQYLQEAALRNVQARDAQENVRRFLDFQQSASNEVPPTPPFEIKPPMQAPKEGLRALPKLSIPGGQSVRAEPTRASQAAQSAHPQQQQQQQQQSFVPYRMEKADPRSPDLQTPTNPYRFGTPFSEVDVPVTAIPLDRIERNASQSVPPDMNYHHVTSVVTQAPPPRALSRTSARRPSFPVMPALEENAPTPVARTSPKTVSPQRAASRPQPPLQAPPRANYAWSSSTSVDKTKIVPAQEAAPSSSSSSSTVATQPSSLASATTLTSSPDGYNAADNAANGIAFQGPMKKRKTRMLRHEWQDGYFTLKGTRLAMHKDAFHMDRTLEYVDIDDYAIACSSLASQSKLSAAFKRVHLTSGSKDTSSIGAFAFQLIPQEKNGHGVAARLRKRESSGFYAFASSSSSGASAAEGANGTGKTHHFAVKNRDERIDWMRELMLAKALRQKGEGFEVSVNGNMI
ncbi:hypothetical protein SODALDRAFT_340985 [Sodiomyces alkalinus F11]|uniref:SAM and PH domain-containing protein n=1 Tax=Sodiomyces alkalinus (strain CBS 110278 / VKM F-3762 / F11) TaxID=1314773 RepID=A0A3N2PQL0_SODAK|nr:hypothetical protein SODALDRAFT_340985 [Sodiomyces alkalinus F11]ROT36797.1 hypothetical protein SODALDRAFT_340985 [Sodiomyces alkalinus F11]